MSLFRNILELIEFFEDNSCFYLVFEKLRGGECEMASTAITQSALSIFRWLIMNAQQPP